jgi:ubiquinone biosynthesis UbiH/UbiF/VisC/COQ6 family hydroxylase
LNQMTPNANPDVAVVGAGIPGLAVALGLAQQGLHVALIGPPTRAFVPSAAQVFDPRVYAVSPGSVALLNRLGVWPRVDAARTSDVERMRVFGDDGEELSFDAYAATVERLATIVEEAELLRVLDAASDYQPTLQRKASPMVALQPGADNAARVTLEDGSVLDARLVIGADGAASAVRAAMGLNAETTLYGQTAVVANFACERPHLNTAWQWFCDEGVVALLPLPGEHVSLVWSAPDSLAQELAELAPEALAARVSERARGVLGALRAVGRQQRFGLRLMTVDRLIGRRMALVGDAAHVIHPLAGQGLNLGLQDVALLLDVVREREAFRDLGDAVLLRRYERGRAESIGLMRAATDGLARLFATGNPAVRSARNAGLAAVNRLTPLKNLLIRQALG